MATQLDQAVADAPVVDETNGATAQDTGATDDLSAMYPDEGNGNAQDTGVEPGQEGEQPTDDQLQADEAETPIDPPVSWNKEAKEKFAQLPPDMQTFLAEQDAHRNRQVTEVTTRAAEAQRQAQEDVAARVAESQQYYAQQVEFIAQQFLPPEPDPRQFSDMGSFAAAKHQYDQAVAQHQTLMQHAGQIRTQADQQFAQQQQQMLIQDARRVAVELPEVHDQSQYQQLVQDLTPIARELGYDDQRISQALPSDVLAMKRVSGWKEKAAKWDALQARKMEGVRAAKANLPKVTQPGAGGKVAQTDDPIKLLYPNG